MSSLTALLNGLIDYAGLFPPAKLPLEPAIRNYSEYRQSADHRMLSRFIIPVARLSELSHFGNLFVNENPFKFSVLGNGASHVEVFLANMVSDLNQIESFRQQFPGRVSVDFLEVPLPRELLKAPGIKPIEDLVAAVAVMIRKQAKIPLQVFYEITGLADRDDGLSKVMQGISRFREKSLEDGTYDPISLPGIKLRCGGVEAAAFPSADRVAAVIENVIRFAVPFKATAGLHHPLRHFNAEVQTRMHGFINVFGGAVLAGKHKFSRERLKEVLVDENPANFTFSKDEFAWRKWSISSGEIAKLRRERFISFGSCSFDEPRQDLRSLGWIK